MCGIYGIYDLSGQAASCPELKAMSDALRHRGPDASGIWQDHGISLGHERLSIIDLSDGANQPFHAEGLPVCVVLNGEIYNYRELRMEFESSGYRFRTQSDTEVLLVGYLHYGREILQRLNGMFAFAIWDGRSQQLWCCRDRFGIKPFYYYFDGTRFVFGSEIKAVLFAEGVPRRLNPEGLADYLTFQYCLADKTLFHGIKQLEPGKYLTVCESGLRVQPYWELHFHYEGDHKGYQNWIEDVRGLIHDSVKLELRSDVPVGCHLSGGLDSSTVASVAALTAKTASIKVFTGKFREGGKYDETAWARSVVEKYANLEMVEVVPSVEDVWHDLQRLVYLIDQPSVGPALIPQYHVSRTAREYVTVALGGQGGDEIFAGYPRMVRAALESALHEPQDRNWYGSRMWSPTQALSILRRQYGWRAAAGSVLRGDMDFASRYYRYVAQPRWMERDIQPRFRELLKGYSPYQTFREIMRRSEGAAPIDRAVYFEARQYLPALLHVEDRTSMGVALESRVPLLDHRIAELMCGVPMDFKVGDGSGKPLLRDAARPFLPDMVANRRDKRGFPTPIEAWFSGSLAHRVDDMLANGRLVRSGLVDSRHIADMKREGRNGWGIPVWQVVNLELWLETFGVETA